MHTEYLGEFMKHSNPQLLSKMRDDDNLRLNNATMNFNCFKYKNYAVNTYEQLMHQERDLYKNMIEKFD